MGQRGVGRDPHRREREEVLVALERRGDDPEERPEEEEQRGREPEVGEEVGQAAPHSVTLRPSRDDPGALDRNRHQAARASRMRWIQRKTSVSTSTPPTMTYES